MGLRPFAHWLKDLVVEIHHHRLSDEAAKIAYFLLISLFPFLLVVFSLVGRFAPETVAAWALEQLLNVVPRETAEYISRYVHEVVTDVRPELLVAGVLLFIWSGSNLLVTLTVGLNRIIGVPEGRRWWHRRLMAMAFVAALAVSVAVWGTLVTVASSRVPGLDLLMGGGQSTLLYLLLAVVLFAVYVVMPNYMVRPSFRRLAAAALASSAIWWVASAGFRVYLATYARYTVFYGFVAGWLILLLWLYILGYSILVGAVVGKSLPARKNESRSESPKKDG